METMNSHCSTILDDALPPKEKDLGSFTLPCYINNMTFNKALADLEASVSVMPYSTFTNQELRRNQEVDNLGPTIKEGEIIDEPMVDIVKTRQDDKNVEGIDEYLRFYNSIMKDKIKYRAKNVVGAFMNVPIFVENFCVVTDFVVVENMDAYRNKDMGDVIVGMPFHKASSVEARQFDGLITIHDGNDNVTYQMA
ncbi:hypothetical protein Tco_1094419 [Tanacetum coccineum]|uniref:Uncharacterized protein n=1 Tax=Tanacetum coccineum TaxID=301880 RepID=A0ABQ5IFF8_9ASTR